MGKFVAKRDGEWVCFFCEKKHSEVKKKLYPLSFSNGIFEWNILACGHCLDILIQKSETFDFTMELEIEELKKEREKEMLEWDEKEKEAYFLMQKAGASFIGDLDEFTQKKLNKKWKFER